MSSARRMRRESARLQPGKLRAVAVFAVTESGARRDQGRPELALPCPASASALPPPVPRCGEEDKSASSGLRDLRVLMEQKLAGREGSREGRGEGRAEKWQLLTKYFSVKSVFAVHFSLHKK